MSSFNVAVLFLAAALTLFSGCSSQPLQTMASLSTYTLDFNTPVDPELQTSLEAIDARIRGRLGIPPNMTAAGILDLNTLRLAMLRPDAIDYAASLPKIGILLAYFQMRPEAATFLDATTRHELGLMIKASDNEVAAKYSQEFGLKQIQQVIHAHGFYDAQHGGGLWMGKHYGLGGERHIDPVGHHSHAATVRQLLRFYLALEQGRLVSPAASNVMREIFASPDVAHLQDKFVRGLAGRNVQVLRKAGWWEEWFHDTAVVSGGGRHYIMVAMTHHSGGDSYLVEFARAVDDVITR